MEPKTPSNNSLEEYKTLRAEIFRSFDAADKNILACITANGVALAYGAKEANVYVLILACMLPIYFWIQHALYRTEVAKLSAYITVFLESPKSGLMWETRVHKADLAESRGGKLAYAARAIILPYPILVTVSLLTMLGSLKPESLNVPLAIVLSAIAILVIILAAILTNSSLARLRKHWLEIYENIKEEERNLAHGVPVTALLSSEHPTRGLKRTPDGAA
ncbi:MAG: hypothetical protein ACJ76Y_11320 [Thermoanaerobaculia bacterium]